MKKIISKKLGFTLIETIIYIAIFSFIMVSALVSIYAILESNSRNQTKAMVAEEGGFLISKIEWLLHGSAHTVLNTNATEMIISTQNQATLKIRTNPANNVMQVDEGNGYLDLNNSNTIVTCPPLPNRCFTIETTTGDNTQPENIESQFTIATKTSDGIAYSQDFSNKTYLRK